MTVVQDIAFQFETINTEYLNKLDNLLKQISKKKHDVLLNKESKLNYEKKARYKTILKFTFEQFEAYFIDFKENFMEKANLNLFDIKRSFADYNTQLLPELHFKQQKFKEEISNTEYFFNKLRKKKENYYDYVHKVKLVKLNQYKNFKWHTDKRKLIRI